MELNEKYEYHFHCTRCNKDLSCNEDKDFDWTDSGKFYFIEKCPHCGGEIEAGFPKEFVNIGFKNNPRLSWALGCDKHQLPAMQKKHPGAEFVKSPSGGYQMRIKNRTEKKRRMSEAKMEEY